MLNLLYYYCFYHSTICFLHRSSILYVPTSSEGLSIDDVLWIYSTMLRSSTGILYGMLAFCPPSHYLLYKLVLLLLFWDMLLWLWSVLA